MNAVRQVDVKARVLIAGSAEGKALVLDEPLSFWGGFDPHNGEIIDVHHPQYRQQVTHRILFIPSSRGSAGTPGGIAETLRNNSGPAAIVIGHTDLNIAIGTLVANRLYALEVPLLEIIIEQMQCFKTGEGIKIDRDGRIHVQR